MVNWKKFVISEVNYNFTGLEEPIRVKEIEDIDEEGYTLYIMESKKHKLRFMTEEQCYRNFNSSLKQIIYMLRLEGHNPQIYKGYTDNCRRTFDMIIEVHAR